MTTTRRVAQPPGEAGVQHTLDKVAELAARGGEDPRVRSHATYVLKACGWPTSKLERARCLLADTRTLHHVDDPVNAEHVPEAWTMMPNHVTGEAPMFVAEDCDGLTVRWLALCLAAGIPAKVVGYWYGENDDRHVAGAIWDDVGQNNGGPLWLDGDPSLQNLPLGKSIPFTRRQERELPSMTITCDDTYCPIHTPPISAGVDHFVSVGSPPAGEKTMNQTNAAANASANATGDVGAEVLQALGDEMNALDDMLDGKWGQLKIEYDDMRARAAAYGITDIADLAKYGWSADNQQSAIDAGVMTSVMTGAMRDANAGSRGVWPVQLPNGETTFAIEKKPGDTFSIQLDADGNPVILDNAGATFHGKAQNTIGAWQLLVIAAAAAVGYVAAAYAIGKLLDNLSSIVRQVTRTFLESKIYECRTQNPPCTEAELQRRLDEQHKYQIDQAKADAELEKAKAEAPGALDAFNKVVYVLGAVASIWGGVQVIKALTEHKSTARAT